MAANSRSDDQPVAGTPRSADSSRHGLIYVAETRSCQGGSFGTSSTGKMDSLYLSTCSGREPNVPFLFSLKPLLFEEAHRTLYTQTLIPGLATSNG